VLFSFTPASCKISLSTGTITLAIESGHCWW
jgi:hypothetical protein